MQLKLGEHRVYHFAHKQLTACPLASGETAYHQAGKEAIMNWLKGLGHKPALEKYMSNIHQRPDVTVSIGNENYAIEFQCANISRQELREEEQQVSARQGSFPIWMIGANRLNRKICPFFFFLLHSLGNFKGIRGKALDFFFLPDPEKVHPS
ncbi:hypothetical protein BsIDN1_21390 [Bacillus safensis]|uniref:Competence protein CoiA nuclease-like domain-containing protein n=1 Tax=Bacillus safensis TaxID=561879 RepID=A0A5S9M6F8_BACIA|nr:hypothetical protein BsIDN1_21390 [Bacillus safensis]